MDPIARMVAAGAAGASGSSATYVDDLFSTALYTGNGNGAWNGGNNTVPSGLDFTEGDWLSWIKLRDAGDSHFMSDSTQKTGTMYDSLASDRSYGKQTGESTGISAVGTNSYTIDGQNAQVNGTDKKYVAWNFKTAPGFFDIQTWTGNATAGRTIAHNLGSVPGMILIKDLDTGYDWAVYHRSLANTHHLRLNQSAKAESGNNYWNNTTATSTHFTISDNGNVNYDGSNYVAYIFAHDDQSFGTGGDESIIKCGSYTGTGSGNINDINVGFEAQWVLIKNTTSASDAYGPADWTIYDMMRGFNTTDSKKLHPNTSAVEASGGRVFPTATGFAINNESNIDFNASGDTYIYMAIRRPHKPPTAATEVFDVGLRSGSSSDAKTNSSILTDMSFILRRDSSSEYNGISSRLQGINNLFLSNTGSEGTGWLDSNTPWAHMTGIMIGGSNGAANTGNLIDFSFKRAPGFFDVVAYTGNGSARTIPHNLGATPSVVIVKSRDVGFNWYWQHYALGANTFMQINSESQATNGSLFNSTLPTSSVFSVGDLGAINNDGDDYIAYLFGDLNGISKAAVYTGTGNEIDVDCGFTTGARFVMIKRVDGNAGFTDQGDWYVWNSARGIVSGSDPFMKLNTTDTEFTGDDYIDPLNAGFTVTSSAPADLNANGGTYLFLAIA